jgi:hypothetical protein
VVGAGGSPAYSYTTAAVWPPASVRSSTALQAERNSAGSVGRSGSEASYRAVLANQ